MSRSRRRKKMIYRSRGAAQCDHAASVISNTQSSWSSSSPIVLLRGPTGWRRKKSEEYFFH